MKHVFLVSCMVWCIGGLAGPAGATGHAAAAATGTVSGTVIRADTSAPVASLSLTLCDASYNCHYSWTDASGVFTFTVDPGTYFLFIPNAQGLFNEIYDNIQCVGYCWPYQAITKGTAIVVTSGGAVSGKDFALQPAGSITGTVRSLSGGAPIPFTAVSVYTAAQFGNGHYVTSGYSDSNGTYVIGGLTSGVYYASTDAPEHIDEIYGGVPCLGFCSGSITVSAGTPITVSAAAVTGDINFSLRSGGRIAGVVRNAATSAALGNAWVSVYRNVGTGIPRFMGSAVTDEAGAYALGGLPTGDYYVVTDSSGFHNQIHSGIACPGWCSADRAFAHGTPVRVTATGTTGGIDFALNPMTGRIVGHVTDATTSAPLPDRDVLAYARVGADYQAAGVGYTDASGAYQISLPPGTYHLVARSSDTYLGEIYDNIPCGATCKYGVGAVALGTAVAVTTGTVTVDFALQREPALPPGPPELWGFVAGGTVTLHWSEAEYGGSANDFILEVGFSPGTTFMSIPVAGWTFERAGVPPGRYFFRVRGRNSRGIGPPSGEFELTVNPDGSGAPGEPENLVLYVEGNRLYADWTGPWYGGGSDIDYVLEAGTATGLSDLGTFAVGSRTHFELEPPPPPGVYFVRVRGRNAQSIGRPSRECMLVIGDVPAPPDAPGHLGFAVDAARRVTVAWAAPRGAITGYVLEAGTASGRYDLGAFVLPAAPTFAVTPGAVPPGMYFVRIRAFNAHGAGVATFEEILIVP